MKKALILLILCFTTALFAQSKHEKIKALKVAHITKELDLTTKEAEEFWPIYNASEEKLHALRRTERKEIIKKIKDDFESLTNAEATALIEKSITIKEKELETFRQLVKDLKGIIPPKKIILLRKAEEDFKRQLLERFKKKRGN
ncbi:hypothetical protein [Marinirhabdus gelatinilytica]|uniref:LTXXQ motif family protein n=1 Tax=Marinirhabdus gelatinilytica TaxID=1703343 RepID=A0A370QFT3_9FLAO|nr:hypothetical protein [Marinirhabdus gelatinilytica]RDK86900.1 hypothetical protein C8D94_10278 [Marinirhabdus gelatinilytica]